MPTTFRKLVSLFGLRYPDVTAQADDDARGLVARMARGNVSLQRGRYVTEQQMATRRDRVLAYRFIKPKAGA